MTTVADVISQALIIIDDIPVMKNLSIADSGIFDSAFSLT